MKESEYSKDSDWISPPSKGERLGFAFDPLVSCSSSSFLSPALRSSSVSPTLSLLRCLSFIFVIILPLSFLYFLPWECLLSLKSLIMFLIIYYRLCEILYIPMQ